MHAMPPREYDHRYGQYQQRKLRSCSGLLQAGRRKRHGLFDRHLQFHCWRDLMHGLFGRHLQFQYWFDLVFAMPCWLYDNGSRQLGLRGFGRLLRLKQYA